MREESTLSVAELGKKGLTATHYAATARLHKDLNDALDRAQGAGVTVEMIVGMLECTKGAVLDSYFRNMEEMHGE